jgi:tetratricopeptide (TPR) repeat protein
VAAIAIALVVFLLGALVISRPGADVPPSVLPTEEPAEALVAPALGGSVEGTIAALRERVRRVPEDAAAYAALSLAYVRQAAATADPTWYARAEEAIDRSFELAPEGSVEAFLARASLAAGRHEFAEALAWGRRAVAADPHESAAYGIVGDALLELGRTRAAFRAFQRMVDVEPGLASYARVSYARELTGDLPGAIRAMRTARAFAGTNADAAWASAHVGLLELRRGRLAAAAEALREAQAFAPGSILAEAGLARLAAARGDLAAARARLDRLVERYPAPEYARMLGEVCRVLGHRACAREADALVRVQARLAAAQGVNTDLEIALFEADRGNPAAALRAARAEWERRRSVHVADALAWALHANGRDAEASRYARRALSLGTPDGTFLYHAGVIALALGRRAEGERLLERALSVDPYFSVLGARDARRLLGDLRAPS